MRVSATAMSIGLAFSVGCTACGGSSALPAPALTLPEISQPGACAAEAASRGLAMSEQTVGVAPADASRAVFDIGSAAKSFTAAAVVLLAQDGKLSLTAPISRYLPHVPADKRGITAEQLLTHTSGLPQNFTSDQTRIGRAAAERAILALHLGRAGPFNYSNAGYTLLAAIVERVAGEPFHNFVQRRLLDPNDMRSTSWYGATPGQGTPVDGHAGSRDTGPAGTQAPGSWATLGAGGMISTADDLLRWVQATNAGTVFNTRWQAQVFRGRVPTGPPGAKAAYGWVVGTTPAGEPVRLVGGDTDYGFTSDLRYYPRQQVATVALSCSDSSPAIDLGHALESVTRST